MKPLVYYCRWQGAVLRLRGRDETAVWGHFVFQEADSERQQFFHFELANRILTVGEGDDAQKLQLDEMGIVV